MRGLPWPTDAMRRPPWPTTLFLTLTIKYGPVNSICKFICKFIVNPSFHCPDRSAWLTSLFLLFGPQQVSSRPVFVLCLLRLVTSCHVLSRLVTSCHVLSRLVLWSRTPLCSTPPSSASSSHPASTPQAPPPPLPLHSFSGCRLRPEPDFSMARCPLRRLRCHAAAGRAQTRHPVS